MRFLNPKTDFAFKRIFDSDHSKEILLSFLNAILELESPYRIADLTILDPYLAPKIQGIKDTYLDVRAQDEQGKSYIIEMQVLNVAAFEKRVLYNACKTYAGQIDRGEDYHLLTDIIAITITDFLMFDDLPAIVNKFRLRAEAGRVYSEDLELVFAELPKFTKTEAELETVLDRWLFFLKHAGRIDAVPATLQTEPAIVRAFDIANKAGLTREELDDQERREIFIQDQRGALELAEQRGMKKGAETGRAEERKRIAQALLNVMADDALIAQTTGLSIDEVRALR
jgi:predicted transposase/invertase (TIGR01784 family)